MDRRMFLSGWAAALGVASGGERPPVTHPRATSGDSVAQPSWEEKLTISVGQKNADLVGTNEKVIQAAVDSVARWGGGTVKVLPGEYRFRNAVYLQSGVRILGSGLDSVIVKEPSIEGKLAADSDWYDQEVTLADARGFQVGDGVCLRAKNPHNGGATVLKRTLVARSGNRFKLDKALRENLWLPGTPKMETLFPLFSGENVNDLVFENITLDGNKDQNQNLDGNYAGCIFLQDCNRVQMRGVTARNYNGDGISWQICHDVLVEECHSHDNTGLGLHPGSGSQRPVMRKNRLVRNDLGLFFCWGVKYGLAEQNTIEENRRFGISIGHRDTDNLIQDNDVRASGEVGILFRKERGAGYTPNRNRVENNRIVDVAKDTGAGIEVEGLTREVVIRANQIRHTGAAGQRVGVRLGSETALITLAENKIEGFSEAVVDLRKKAEA